MKKLLIFVEQKKTMTETLKNYTEQDFEIASRLVYQHNQKVGESKIIFVVDLTGAKRCYFTLYRFNSGPCSPHVNPYTYLRNLSLDLVEAVKKVATGKGLPILLYSDENRLPERFDADQISFGKYKGQTLSEVYEKDPGYIVWLAKNHQPDTKRGQKFSEMVYGLRDLYFQALSEKNLETCKSIWVGEPKSRLDLDLTVLYKKIIPESNPKYLTQDSNGNLFEFWSALSLEKDSQVRVRGTVTKHIENLSRKITRINRVALVDTK
jgi:uncharacterized protein (DUF3820 family)